MPNLYKSNKIAAAVILIAVVIGGLVYFSNSGSNTNQQQGASLQTPQKQLPKEFAVSFREAPNHIGEYAVISGLVDNVFISNKGTKFLNFCPNYRTCPFSAVIFNSDAYKFLNVRAYEGRLIEISGTITTYQGRAQIIIKDPSQIKLK